jgi:hypothetical protein
MVGAGDVLLIGMHLAGLPLRSCCLHRPHHPPVIDYQFTQGNGCASRWRP